MFVAKNAFGSHCACHLLIIFEELFVKPCLHWQRLRDNVGDSNSQYLLALATLGSVTCIEVILSVLHRPRWPRQVKSCVTVADGFANKHRQCK
jgi:hypothetical protein